MVSMIQTVLSKIDYRLSPHAFSRPQEQVRLIIEKLRKQHIKKILDVGGGDGQYKNLLTQITDDYKNLEIKKNVGVDIVGSIYKIPLSDASVDLVTLFMVLEHLNEPTDALKECHRVLAKNGYLAITTVQYWHTHNYPNDYFRYTRQALIYLCKKAGFRVEKIWSHGGPFLVIFHAIEINMTGIKRTLFSIFFFRLADYLDWKFFGYYDRRPNSDSVGWSLIARKI